MKQETPKLGPPNLTSTCSRSMYCSVSKCVTNWKNSVTRTPPSYYETKTWVMVCPCRWSLCLHVNTISVYCTTSDYHLLSLQNDALAPLQSTTHHITSGNKFELELPSH
jgi:hypothetical protein